MLNRFRKMLSILCAAALLLSCLPVSFAEPGETPEEAQVNESGNPAETPVQEGEGTPSEETPVENPTEGSSEEPVTKPETPAAEIPGETQSRRERRHLHHRRQRDRRMLSLELFRTPADDAPVPDAP